MPYRKCHATLLIYRHYITKSVLIDCQLGPPRGGQGGTMTPGPMDLRGANQDFTEKGTAIAAVLATCR